MSRPIELGPSIRVNGWTQAPAAIDDRPVGRVEDGVGIDPRRLVDEQPVGRSDQGGGRQMAVAQADLPLGVEVADHVLGVAGDDVPGPVDPLAADLLASDPARHVLEPGVDAVRLERHGLIGPDQGAGGLAVAKPEPGARARSGGSKAAGGTQRPLATSTGPRASQSRSLTAVCGSRARWTAARYGRITAPRRSGPGPIPNARAIFAPERGGAQKQVEDRSGQGQRLKAGDGVVLDQAETHVVVPMMSPASAFSILTTCPLVPATGDASAKHPRLARGILARSGRLGRASLGKVG